MLKLQSQSSKRIIEQHLVIETSTAAVQMLENNLSLSEKSGLGHFLRNFNLLRSWISSCTEAAGPLAGTPGAIDPPEVKDFGRKLLNNVGTPLRRFADRCALS